MKGVIDFYDDPTGDILRRVVPRQEALPDFIKTAERLTPQEMSKLPDDVFALVALDRGAKMRKFACADKGNTALSVIYFMENRDKLPAEAQKVAAQNLVKSCQWYDLEPPDTLQKIALLGPAMLALQATQAGGHIKRRQKALKAGASGQQVMKMSELSGSHPMPKTRTPQEKTAAVLTPHVDITGQQPPRPVVRERGSHYCMVKEGQAKYPIDTVAQVQRADAYFHDHREWFSPADRHQYCTKLAARANQLGVHTSPLVAKYGSAGYSEDLPLAIYQRQQHFRSGASERALLDDMLEKHASIKPEVFAVMLENFDKQSGLDKLWDRSVDDPYYSTFGMQKRAAWSFQHGNERITDADLHKLAQHAIHHIRDRFNAELADEFRQDPVGIFESLPLDAKRLIMRISASID